MLLTRCPHCRTAFRVQAEELEIAGGQVRCGRCAHVFDAYSDLQQLVAATGSGPDIAVASPDPDPATDEPAAEPEAVDSLLSEAAEDDAPAEEVPLTFEVLDEPTEDVSSVGEANAASASTSESTEENETYTAIEREIDEALYGEHGRREESDGAALKEQDDDPPALLEESLEFDLPAGEWDEFFAATEAEGGFLAEAAKELMEPPQPDAKETPEALDDASADSDEAVMSVEAWLDQQSGSDGEKSPALTLAPEAEAVGPAEPSDGPEPTAAEAEGNTAEAKPAQEEENDLDAEADAIVESLTDPDDAWESDDDYVDGTGEALEDDWSDLAATPAAETAESDSGAAVVGDDEGHVMDLTALAATADSQTPALEPEPPAQNQGWSVDPFEEGDVEESRSRWWPVAAAGLIVLLVGQLVHAGRHTLVEQPMLGPLLAKTYTALGAESPGRIDLGNYRLERWIATEKETTSPPSLAITAGVTNLGPRDQPLPLIRLELKDRWDDPVASRVFTPREYLSEDTPEGALSPGASVEANLTIVDPGEEAYGFELDVCIGSAGGRLRCATDPL